MKLINTIFLFTLLGLGLSGVNAQGYAIGDVASDFNLINVDDTNCSLSQFEGANGFIIVFTCNHCPYAVMYEDRLIELHNNFASQGYPVVAIMPNDTEVKPADSFENMKLRAEEKGFPFKYLLDEDQSVYPLYGATKTPHVYLLNANRVVKYIGAIDDSPRDAAAVDEKFLENAIEALKLGQDPDPATTKAIGCSIKTKS